MRLTVARRLALAMFSASLAAPAAGQNCGWSHVDHRVTYDESGVWNPNVYRSVVGALTVAEIGGAVWEGAESRLGKTLWQGIDSQILSGVGATAGKYIFTRVRPSTEDNPCLWFQGGHNYSFPSGEAAVAAGLVTPYILEYGSEYPATYLLALLPLYVGAGRIKNQAHWQTDVIAGWAVGGLSGWYAHSRDVPILIELLPHGVAVGLHKQF
jgi:membrane-associated phospholipid phosphatase